MLLQLTVFSFETTKDFANRFVLGTVYFLRFHVMLCLWLKCKQFEIEESDTVSQLVVKFFLSFSIGSLYFVTAVLSINSHAGEATEVLTIKIQLCIKHYY